MIDQSALMRAAAWLKAWDSQGTHRTGTAGDEAGAAWLAAEAASLGCGVSRETFPLDRLDPVSTFLEIDGIRHDGVPVFDAPPSSAEGLRGRLAPHGSGADTIGVASLPPSVVYTPAYRAIRKNSRHRALVIICQGAEPGLGLLNAEQFRVPYGCPALHLAETASEPVLAAAAKGNQARFVAHSGSTPTCATNVVVTMPGRDPGRSPVVVMTPRSSWWQSTSERGGGLVCWLETLRALRAEPPECDVVLTANSGHELGHLGLDDFIERRPGWDKPEGAIWIHYGANIGAAGGTLSIMSGDDDLRTTIQSTLAAVDRHDVTLAPMTQVPSGETRDIHRGGGRYLTLVGTNRLFHLPGDRYPRAVDVPMIARIAQAAARCVVTLTR